MNTDDVRKSLGLSFKPPKGFVLVQRSNPPHPTTRTWGEKLAGSFCSKPTRQSPCSITPQTRQWLSRHNTMAQKHLSVFRRGRTLRRSLARRRGRWISMPPASRSLGCRTHTSPHPSALPGHGAATGCPPRRRAARQCPGRPAPRPRTAPPASAAPAEATQGRRRQRL